MGDFDGLNLKQPVRRRDRDDVPTIGTVVRLAYTDDDRPLVAVRWPDPGGFEGSYAPGDLIAADENEQQQ